MQLKKLACYLALYCATSLTASIGPVTPYIAIRSQGYDAARELAGWSQQINQDNDSSYWSFYVLPEYTRTFRSQNIFSSLFGTCASTPCGCENLCSTGGCRTNCANSVIVSGSRVENRGSTDLLADYFYLPTDFKSVLNFNPIIENVNVDLNFYLGLDQCLEGLFFRLHVPVTWTRWNLNFCENIISEGTATTGTTPFTGTVNGGYQGGYFSYSPIPTQHLLTSFSSYASGNAPEAFIDPVAGGGTITFDPLNFARITNCARSLSGVADLQAILGYNFIQCEDYHFGAGVFVSAPTGSRPNGQYLFEPVVGNGGSWALGAHITGHALLWEDCDEDSTLGFYLDCNITHLFNAKQTRTFDWVASDGSCKPLGRYMLAEKMSTEVNNLFAGDGTPLNTPNLQFANAFSPIANFSTQKIKVSVGAQGDLAAQFTYTHCGLQFDIGYNFWGRSCEKITLDCISTCTPCTNNCNTPTPTPFTANTWAVKGDSFVYGEADISGTLTPIPLSATQTTDGYADITGGSNFFDNPQPINAPLNNLAARNSSIEFAELAWQDSGATTPIVVPFSSAPNQMNTSDPAVPLTASNIALQGTRGISNKIYANLSYNWIECDDWDPFVGIGAYAEFGPNNCKSCSVNCSTSCCVNNCCAINSCNTGCNTGCCLNAAISQWGVWAKAGITFN